MRTFTEYVGRSIDCLVSAFKSKDKIDWVEEETQFLDFPTKGDDVPVTIEYNLPPLAEEDIRQLAYFKWEQAGRPEGDGKDFWLAAERELNSPLVEDLLLQQ
jgi:hypothetical protein